MAETVECVDGLGAVGRVDDGVVLGLVEVGSAESWREIA